MMWMITKSCNSSTNILIKYLGVDKINKYCKEIGLNATKLERYMIDENAIKNKKKRDLMWWPHNPVFFII